jgi:hypothetical protein
LASVLELAGLGGRVMLVTAAVVLLVGALATLPHVLRVRRRALALRATIEASRADVQAALDLLAALNAERTALLAPWRRLLRWVRHPLVGATLDWYFRRRRS